MARSDPQQQHERLTPAATMLFAIACGAMVANLYYAQTLIDEIGPAIGLPPRLAGMIPTLTQLGYGLGLALLVPLGDLFENKRLTLIATAGTMVACLGIGLSRGPISFLAASFLAGVCATGAQVLLPLATHLTPHDQQGRVIGRIMAGLLTGIMLARPVASFLAETIGWRAVFFLSAALMALLMIALAALCPHRRPEAKLGYGAILLSTLKQVRERRALRLRAFYQAMNFAAFNLFWTAAPLVLLHRFHFSQNEVALFALAGAGGALSAPVAGWLADKGLSWWTSLASLMLVALGFVGAIPAVVAGSVITFAAAAILIDAAVQLNQVTGQKIIFALSKDARARVNAAYMTVVFVIGPMGSLIGSASFGIGGWAASATAGAAIAAITLTVFLLLDRGVSRGG